MARRRSDFGPPVLLHSQGRRWQAAVPLIPLLGSAADGSRDESFEEHNAAEKTKQNIISGLKQISGTPVEKRDVEKLLRGSGRKKQTKKTQQQA